MSAVLLPAVLAGVVVGIVAQDAGVPGIGSPLVLVSGALTTGLGAPLRWRWALSIGLLLVGIAIGSWRGAMVALPSGPGSVSALVDHGSLTILATAVDEPRPHGDRQQLVVDDVGIIDSGGEATPAAGRVLLWLPRGLVVGAGDQVRFDSTLEEPEDFDGFAYRAYLARQGVAAIASTQQMTVIDHQLGAVQEALRAARARLLTGLNGIVPEPEAALAAGILLGVRAGIDPALNDAFARAGLTHVVAISGWNIAIVAALVAGAVRPVSRLPSGRWLAAFAAGGTVTGYVLLTGASPSVVRAALMAGALLLARLGGSRSHAISALMLAALVMVLVAPAVVWDVGFQLSALATAGLIWFGGAFEARLARWPALIREPVALTMAAQVTTLPIVLLNFERLSLIAPLANVVVVPLIPVVMLTSALAALIGALGVSLPIIGDLLAWAAGGTAWLYLRLMVLAGQVAASVPMSSLDLAAPAWLAAVWYPGLFLAHRRMRDKPAEMPVSDAAVVAGGFVTRIARPVPLAAATLATIAVLTFLTQPDGRLHLVVLDIGQGDAILIVAPSGETMLIDGGPDPDLIMRRLGERLPFWQRRIDAIVMTHPHQDHVAGLVPALERFKVGIVLEPGREYDNPTYPRFLALALQEPGATFRLARAGDVISLGTSTRLAILYPSDQDAAGRLIDDDINNASVVMLLESRGFKALLTGDAKAAVEHLLLARELLGPVDVLKVGHHGSESGSTPEMLAVLRPRVAVISCGVDNRYGHPHAITLQRLADVPGITVHRTDLDGTVEVVADGRTITTGQGKPDAGSIGPWWFPAATKPRRSSTHSTYRTASSPIRAASPAWRRRQRAWSPRPAFRSTSGWSRSPPCCMTSTSRKRVEAPGCTAKWRPNG
jgi:competence protein ComEC